MNRKFFLLLISLLTLCGFSFGQKIIMKIPSVTKPGGEEVRVLEFQINAETSFLKGTGAAVGKPTPGSLIIKKTNNQSGNTLLKYIAQGRAIPEVTFEYADASNVVYYIITISNAFLTQLHWLSPECATCPKLEQLVGFVFKTLKTTDVASGTTATWDIATGTVL
jgi:type VI protein secretion system component Hcp